MHESSLWLKGLFRSFPSCPEDAMARSQPMQPLLQGTLLGGINSRILVAGKELN